MSKGRIILALIIVASLATYGYHRYQRSLLSPFIMGTARAGMRFSVIDDEARREMKHGFTCTPAGKGIRICELTTDTPVGQLKVVVDRSGRAAVVQLLATEESVRWSQAGSATIAQWSHVQESDVEPPYPDQDYNHERWQTPDSLWSAEILWHRTTNVPTEMVVVDERRVRRIAESSPTTIFALASAKILHGQSLSRVVKLAVNASVEASNTTDAGAIINAEKVAHNVASLPQCSPAFTSEPMRENGADTSLDETLRPVAEQTIARAYPGRRLVIGEHAMYLSDPAGQLEEVSLYPNAARADGQLYAFAVTFPRRVEAAIAHAKDFDTGGQCRANSEVLLASVDPSTRAVDGIQRVDPDDESLLSQVGALDFAPTADAPPRLIAVFSAVYATTEWYGMVRWNELIFADSLRVGRRSPAVATKTVVDGTESGGTLMPESGSEDPTGLSYSPGDTLRFSTALTAVVTPLRRIALPTGERTLPSGWSLLAQL